MELHEMQRLVEAGWAVHGRVVRQISGWLCFVLVDPVQVSLIYVVLLAPPDYGQIYIHID